MDSIPLSYPDKNWLPWADQRINESNMMTTNAMDDSNNSLPLEKREERFGDSLQQLNKIVERISPDSSGGNYRMGPYQNSKFVEGKNKFRGSYSSSFTDNLSDSAYETFAGDSSFECPPENHYLNSSEHLDQSNAYLDVPSNQNWHLDGWQNVKSNLPKSASLHNIYMKTGGNMNNMENNNDMQNMNMNTSGEYKASTEMSHCYSYDDIQERYYNPYPGDAKKPKFSDINNQPNKKAELETVKNEMCGSKSFLEIGKCLKTSSVEGMSNDEGEKKGDDEMMDGKMSSYNTSYEEDDSKNDGDSNGKHGFMCSHCSFETFKKGQLRKHMSMHGVFLCAHCEFSSEIAEVLDDHRKISHPGLCGRKLCKKCRVLYQGEELEEHERVCSGEKQNWTCPICQKEFKFLSVMKAHARKWHPNESIIIPSKTISASLGGHLDSTQQTSAADSTTGEMTPENEINITNSSIEDFCSHNYMNSKNSCPTDDNMPKDPTTQMYVHRSKMERMSYPEQDHTQNKRVYNKGIEAPQIQMPEVPPLELAFYCDCEGCYTTFRSDKELNVHRSSIHGLPPKRYHCRQPECSMQFAKFGHYKRHQLSHGGGEKKYKCDWPNCGKAFCHTDNLKVHYRRHTDEKPYKCDKCASSYRQKSGLKYHLEKVHDEKSSGKPGRKRKNATLEVPPMEGENWGVDLDINKDSRMLNKQSLYPHPQFDPPKFNAPMEHAFYQHRPVDALHKAEMGANLQDWQMRRVHSEHLHPFEKINPYKKLDEGGHSSFVNPIFHPITKHENGLNYYPNKHMMYPSPHGMSPAAYMPHDRKKYEEEGGENRDNILINMDSKMEINKTLPPMDDKGWNEYPGMHMNPMNMYPGYQVKGMKDENFNGDNNESEGDNNSERNESSPFGENKFERNDCSPFGENKQGAEEANSKVEFYNNDNNQGEMENNEKVEEDNTEKDKEKEERKEEDGCESDENNNNEEEDNEDVRKDVEDDEDKEKEEGGTQFIKTEVIMEKNMNMYEDEQHEQYNNDQEQPNKQTTEKSEYEMKGSEEGEGRNWGSLEPSSPTAKGWPRVLDSSMTESSHPPNESNFSLFAPMEKYLPGKPGLYNDLNKIKPQSERPDAFSNLNFFNMAQSYHPPSEYTLPISLASRNFFVNDNCYFTSPTNFAYSNMYRRPLNTFESLPSFQTPEKYDSAYRDSESLNRIGNPYNFFHPAPQSYEQRPYNNSSDSSMMASPYDFSYSSSALSPFSPPSFSLARPWTGLNNNSEMDPSSDAKRIYPLPYTQPTSMSRYF